MVKEVVRGLDTNDEEDWAVDDVKVLQEDVEEQEHHARDANISMKYSIKITTVMFIPRLQTYEI